MNVLAQGVLGDSGLSPSQVSEYYNSAQPTSAGNHHHSQQAQGAMSMHYHSGADSVSASY